MSNHFAKLEDSARLKSILAFLRYRGKQGCTTLEICQHCNSTRASSDLSELAANGVGIVHRFEGVNGNKRKVYRYWLAEYKRTECPVKCPPSTTIPSPCPKWPDSAYEYPASAQPMSLNVSRTELFSSSFGKSG